MRLPVRRRTLDLALTRLPFSSTLLHWWSPFFIGGRGACDEDGMD